MKRSLHRVGPVADWENIKSKDRNFWQAIAARTKAIITPGNIASVMGLSLVVWGMADVLGGRIILGLVKIIIGRLFDLVDGAVADKTGTKSPLGEAVDATIDKLELVLGLTVLVYVGTLPMLVALAIFTQNVSNVTLTVIAKNRGNELHPSYRGKMAMSLQWGAMILYGLSATFNGDLETTVRLAAHVTACMSLVLGISATRGYSSDAFAPYSRTK